MYEQPVYQLFHVFTAQSGILTVQPAKNAPPVFQSAYDLDNFKVKHPKKLGILRQNWDNKENGGPERYSLNPDLRLIGTGSFIWTEGSLEEPKQLVAVKTHGPSNGKLAQPSTLITQDMINENPNIINIRADSLNTSLNFAYRPADEKILFSPFMETCPKSSTVKKFNKAVEAFQNRIIEAQTYLTKQESPHAGRSIEPYYPMLIDNPSDEEYYRPIQYNNAEGEPIAVDRGLINDSGTNVNILTSVIFEVPHDTELVLFDPEGYNREMRAITRAEMISACRDEKGSVPMTAHYENIRKNPQGADRALLHSLGL
ncbi:MAG: hypothetical protein IT559_08210 [Alphaproteobacteria bacterium]|nr:hypothetical protein [Alphaproteobacteria bacterium]